MPETNLFWDPLSDNILQERDESGVVTADYTTEPGLYGSVISQNRSGLESQFHFDALGSSLAVTDDGENVTDTRAYTAFGEATQQTGSTVFPYQYGGFRGYYRDSETGQYLVRRRPYEPTVCRWLSIDPLYALGGNAYWYAANSPIVLLDPSGLFTGSVGYTLEIGLEAYRGPGGGLTISFDHSSEPCCDAFGKWHNAFSPGAIHHYAVQVRGEVGVGVGIEVKVLGRPYAYLIKFASSYMSTTITCDTRCATGMLPSCCRSCHEQGYDLPGFFFFERLSAGLGAGFTLQGTLNAHLRVCYAAGGKGCPTGLSVGICGHITYVFAISLGVGTAYYRHSMEDCVVLIGTSGGLGV